MSLCFISFALDWKRRIELVGLLGRWRVSWNGIIHQLFVVLQKSSVGKAFWIGNASVLLANIAGYFRGWIIAHKVRIVEKEKCGKTDHIKKEATVNKWTHRNRSGGGGERPDWGYFWSAKSENMAIARSRFSIWGPSKLLWQCSQPTTNTSELPSNSLNDNNGEVVEIT